MKHLFLLLLALLFLVPFAQAQDNFDEDLADILSDYVDESDFGVVVYLNYDGDSAIAVAGLADMEAETPVQEDDLFRLASVTKPFVSTIVLQLVSEGKFELEEPIADYLPAEIIENLENADETTIRQMLQMTSGIFDYMESDGFYEAVYDEPSRFWTAEEVLSFAYGEDAYFETGEDYYYSNSNYILAQILIEESTGKTLSEELEKRIFEPLGMDSCYLETHDVFAQNIVRGYELNEDGDYEDVTEVNDGVGLGDGGIVCAAADLGKFLPALINGELLDDAMLDEMLTVLEEGEGENYGLGIVSEESDYGWEVWHDGAASGFQSLIDYLPDEDLSIVILTNNFDSEIVGDLFYDVVDEFLDE